MMGIRIFFGLISGALAGGFWYIASSLANYMNPNYSNPTIFPITFALVLALAIFANSIARVWGWGILLCSLACFYMPIATFIGASKGAVAMVESSQPGLEQTASAVGATIGTGLVTAFTGFIGFFLGLFLLILSYFLLRTSRSELIEIQQSGKDNRPAEGLSAPKPQRLKYLLVSVLSIGMLVSSFSTIISSAKNDTSVEVANSVDAPSSPTNLEQKSMPKVGIESLVGKWAGEPGWTCDDPISILASGEIAIDGEVYKGKFEDGALEFGEQRYISLSDDRKTLRYLGGESGDSFDLTRCP